MKTSNVDAEEKKCGLYDMILIAESIKTPWEELSEEQQKMWNPFMVNRFISSKMEYVPIIALVEKYKLTPKDHYTFICNLVDGHRKHYFDFKAYKKEKKDEENELLVWACCKEYEIGAREARMYIQNMREDVKESLKEKWEESYKFSH